MSTDGPVDPNELLASLRWDVDSLITNYDGDRVWLRADFNEKGERRGITDCCFEAAPCEHHAKIAAERAKRSAN